jgi:hypothetical protein
MTVLPTSIVDRLRASSEAALALHQQRTSSDPGVSMPEALA